MESELNTLPLCPLHRTIDERMGGLELHYSNDCLACTLNERKELLEILSQHSTYDAADDSVTALRKALAVSPLSEAEQAVIECALTWEESKHGEFWANTLQMAIRVLLRERAKPI